MAASTGTAAMAQTVVDPENTRAEDVVLSPLADVNLHKREVPVVLRAALADPYSLSNISTCAGLETAIKDLNHALGDDIDVAQEVSDEAKMSNGAASVAKSLIGSFIPFRGVVRELSGANANERAWQRAIFAGAVRRAFLKGMGEQSGCAYPARSATPEVVAMLEAERLAAKNARKSAKEKTGGEPAEASIATAAAAPPQVEIAVAGLSEGGAVTGAARPLVSQAVLKNAP